MRVIWDCGIGKAEWTRKAAHNEVDPLVFCAISRVVGLCRDLFSAVMLPRGDCEGKKPVNLVAWP